MSLAKRAAVGLAARDGRVQFSTHVIGIRGDGDLYVILLPVERGVGIDALLLVQEAVGGLDAVFCNHVPIYYLCNFHRKDTKNIRMLLHF